MLTRTVGLNPTEGSNICSISSVALEQGFPKPWVTGWNPVWSTNPFSVGGDNITEWRLIYDKEILERLAETS